MDVVRRKVPKTARRTLADGLLYPLERPYAHSDVFDARRSQAPAPDDGKIVPAGWRQLVHPQVVSDTHMSLAPNAVSPERRVGRRLTRPRIVRGDARRDCQ